MPASMSRGVRAVGRFDSATLGLDRFDFDPDPNLPTLSVEPTFILDASRLGTRFRDGESVPYFYDLTSSPGNAQYTRLPAGGGANPSPRLVKTRPHAGGLSVITFDQLRYYQVDFTMTGTGLSYHYHRVNTQHDGYVFQAGDVLCYDIYWPSSGGGFNAVIPEISLEWITTGAQYLGDMGVVDQNGFSNLPSQNISAHATDQWYAREFPLPGGWVGDILAYLEIACESNTAGSYRARFRDVRVLHENGTSTWLGQGASIRNGGTFATSGGTSFAFSATPDDQSGWYAMTADLASALTRPVTYFAVAYGWPGVGGGRNVIDGQDARNALYWSSAGSVWAMYAGTNEMFGATAESQPMTDAVAVAGTFNSTSSVLYRSGVVDASGTSIGTASLDRLRVGTWNEGEGGGQWSDWIGEILVYDGTLTGTDIHKVGAYLRDKWAVDWVTPVPNVQTVGAIDAQTASGSISLDSNTIDNDICILALWTNASNTFTTPTGFTPITGAASESNVNMSYKFFWRRMLASDSKTLSISTSGGTALDAGNGLYGRWWNIRNCKTTGDPFEAVSATTPAQGTTPSTGAISGLSGNNRLGLSIVLVDDDPTWSSGMPPATWTNAGPRSSSSLGGDAMADAIQKTVNESGATDEASVDFGVMSLNVYWARLTLALLPM